MFTFVFITLVLLWLFQIIFLDSFYRQIKTKDIKDTANELVEILQKLDIHTAIEDLPMEENMYIRLVDGKGNDLYSENRSYSSIINDIETKELQALIEKVNQNGGDYLSIMEVNGVYRKTVKEIKESPSAPVVKKDDSKGANIKKESYRKILNLLYLCKAEDVQKNQVYILINTFITPMGATERILKIELFYIIVILFLVSGVLAYVMYYKISRPMIQLEKRAKTLAWGNFSQSTVQGGYKEIIQLNESLNYAAKELAHTENIRRELLANVSHDLRTPLTMIIGFSEMLRDIPEENNKDNIQIIIDEAKRLTCLVNDILDVSKLQSGTTTLSMKPFNMTKCIQNLLKTYAELIKKEKYTIEFESMQEAYVLADEIKIAQVLYNLIQNALNYTGEKKTITIRQSVEQSYVKIEVIDFGEGIDKEEIPYIWERYYKAKHKKQILGTGLGLSIVKNILELHQVPFGVESEKGKGSNFWFYLHQYNKE